jgi:hypothetical protein
VKNPRRRPRSDSEDEDTKMKKRLQKGTKNDKMDDPVPTQNKFQPLSDHEDSDIDDQNSEAELMEDDEEVEQSDNVKTEKPPPIIMHAKYDYKEIITFCKEHTKAGVNIKYTKDKTIIFANEINDFKNLKKELQSAEKTQWHTYATKDERTHGFVIYGLQNRPDEEEVKEDLIKKNINCKTVYKMKNTNTPLYVVITDNKTTLNEVQEKVRTVQQVVVNWKKLINKKEIIQCHKCQSWGHSAANCFAKTKCLKCAGQHLTSECKLRKDNEADQQKIKCANCGERHLANSTECPTYQSRRAHLEKTRLAASEKRGNKNKKFVPAPSPTTNPWTQKEKPEQKQSGSPRQTEPASATQTQTDEINTSDFMELAKELRRLNEIINIKKLLEIVRELTNRLKTCKDPFEQIQIIFDISTKLSASNGP